MGKLSHTDIVHLLVQLSVMLLVGRLLAEAARKFKQPAVIGEIIAGIFCILPRQRRPPPR